MYSRLHSVGILLILGIPSLSQYVTSGTLIIFVPFGILNSALISQTTFPFAFTVIPDSIIAINRWVSSNTLGSVDFSVDIGNINTTTLTLKTSLSTNNILTQIQVRYLVIDKSIVSITRFTLLQLTTQQNISNFVIPLGFTIDQTIFSALNIVYITGLKNAKDILGLNVTSSLSSSNLSISIFLSDSTAFYSVYLTAAVLTYRTNVVDLSLTTSFQGKDDVIFGITGFKNTFWSTIFNGTIPIDSLIYNQSLFVRVKINTISGLQPLEIAILVVGLILVLIGIALLIWFNFFRKEEQVQPIEMPNKAVFQSVFQLV